MIKLPNTKTNSTNANKNPKPNKYTKKDFHKNCPRINQY